MKYIKLKDICKIISGIGEIIMINRNKEYCGRRNSNFINR